MTLLLTSGSNHTISQYVEHTAPHREGGDKAHNDDITANKRQQPYHISVEHTAPHRGGGNKAHNDDITTNKRQQPYHTSVEHTGGAGQPKRPQAPLHRGGRGRGQTRPDGESNNAKQDNYPLDRQGGIPWGGGRRGGVAALHHICTYIYIYILYIIYIYITIVEYPLQIPVLVVQAPLLCLR